MKKQEAVRAYKTVRNNWNLEVRDEEAMVKTWWRYIGDLEIEHVLCEIDRMAIAGQRWAPRPGELRRIVLDTHVLDNGPPTEAEAWRQFLDTRDSASHGTTVDTMHDTTRRTTRALGVTARMLKGDSGADRDYFLKAYREQLAADAILRYGVNDIE